MDGAGWEPVLSDAGLSFLGCSAFFVFEPESFLDDLPDFSVSFLSLEFLDSAESFFSFLLSDDDAGLSLLGAPFGVYVDCVRKFLTLPMAEPDAALKILNAKAISVIPLSATYCLRFLVK